MADSPSLEQKLGFIDAFLRVLETRAPEVARPFRDAMVAVQEKPTARKIDSVYSDLLDWCRGLPASDRHSVSELLQSTIGVPLDFFDSKRLERIAAILRRGHLRSDDEWRFIEERIQELSEAPAPDEEVKRLDELLAAYEAKKSSRTSR
jgi:hypothetical protein